MKTSLRLALCLSAALLPTIASAAPERFTVIFGGRNVGHLNADTNGDTTVIDYDFKNNGRGPTIAETLRVGADGLPAAWTISGATTFGSKVAEQFAIKGRTATWTDSTGPGSARLAEPSLYVGQSASPWALGLYARALLKDADGTLPTLPGGTLRLAKGDVLQVAGKPGPETVTAYELTGTDLNPDTVLLDAQGGMFGFVTPEFIVVRQGYEGEEERLRGLAAKWSTDRYVAIQKKVAHAYAAPVRIRNVRLFDPRTQALTAPVAVLVNGREIAAIEPLDSPATPGEVTIDGAGGTLVAGMYEMHAHISQDDALLNLMAGITTVRDMGNDNAVLDKLIERIDGGVIAGPHVVRSGFLEGRSPFNANNGIVVESEAQAVDAVRWYAARGYWQIKVYNSMNPAWVPAVVAEAHRLGLRVAGHVPAFSSADAMIAAGYDEMTHINQFMLGWVLQPKEDTRTLLRLTALKRLQTLDLNSAKVQATIAAMAERKLAIDVTLGIHEMLTQNRDGQMPPGAVDYLDHMPIGFQRGARKAMVDTSAPGDDAAYRAAFDKIVATVKMLNDRGVLIVPGTDTGGSFTYHRELELYQKVGMTPAQILKRATWDMAAYLGQDQRLGSIEKGKLADFFLIPGDPTRDLKAIKTISMVAKDGVFYFPSEVYPNFGIKPFAPAPKVTPATAR
ncbi:Imidazolonepropionase [Sphingomonas laterariae]|uniref:Imidazolonepropionase n=1 Tax=Edaphosphingomonas laterariae TaxID=861865 RepID=A0A239GBS5_9SPHN|nr:amidohydrolase family protein [Sphingomonas laterariae]SNS65913.1 Imidazolonepropionase [Sphingomonas laterariae]